MNGGGRLNPTEYLQLARNVGADYVIQKPFNNLDLVQLVDKALQVTT
jgi:CheY-like chemotaxis protein